MGRKKGRRIDYMLKFPTVKYWLGQLNDSGLKNGNGNHVSTRVIYLTHLAKFSEWLPGRAFDVRVQAVVDGKIARETSQKSFAHVEELLRFGEEGFGNEREAKKVINQYLKDPMHAVARPTMLGICSAIKSYFDTHDVMTNVRYSGRDTAEAEIEVTEDPELDIVEFYKMLTTGKADPLLRAVLLVKFQAGLDSSTLADGFNFYAYKQISKWCGTDDHTKWDPDKCPIPIRLKRVKTTVKYTTFIDRDALELIKVYLSWREKRHGPRDPKKTHLPYQAKQADTRDLDRSRV